MEHWCDELSGDLDEVGPALVEQLALQADAYLKARCLTVVGDALLEVREFGAAAEAFRLVRAENDEVDGNHPFGIHAVAQEARCRLEQGSPARAQELMNLLDAERLRKLGEMVATVRSEHVRYLAVRTRCQAPSPDPEIGKEIASGLQFLGPILSPDRGDRTSHLRMLYLVLLNRDVEVLQP